MAKNYVNGGHAPNHIRDEFLEAVEDYIRARKPDAEAVKRLYVLSGKLWSCDNILPGDWAHEIAAIRFYPAGAPSTYARAARGLRMRIPTKPAMHSDMKPATDSDLKPARVPI